MEASIIYFVIANEDFVAILICRLLLREAIRINSLKSLRRLYVHFLRGARFAERGLQYSEPHMVHCTADTSVEGSAVNR